MIRDWRALVRSQLPELERDSSVLDELAQHLADLYVEAIADGRSDGEAFAIARAALLAERDHLAREVPQARTGLIARLMLDVRNDVVYGIRTLWRSSGYTTVVLLTLALGIGANSAIFAAVDIILLRPMPYAHADRLYVPMTVDLARNEAFSSVSFADYTDWRRESEVFEAVALWEAATTDVTGEGPPARVELAIVSVEYFNVVTVTPLAGRTFIPADHEEKAPRVTVLTHKLWQQRFAGSIDAVGKTIAISGVAHEVVGILPPRVVWPENVELFTPMRPARWNDDIKTRRDNLIFSSIALLRPGVDIERGNAVLRTIAARVAAAHPESRKDRSNRLEPLRTFMVPATARRALWVLLGAVAAVLLIGCANLAHLALVRGFDRSREFGVRVALGASRWRLARQLVVESLLLALIGAIAGLLLGAWMVKGLAIIAPDGIPFIDQLALDSRVVAVSILLTVLAVLVAALLPTMTSVGRQPSDALKEGTRTTGSSPRVRLMRHALIVAEVASAVVLLTGATLLVTSLWRLQQVDPGIDADRVLMARLSLPYNRYPDDKASAQFFENLIERLNATPEVAMSAATSFVPVGGGGFGLGRSFLREGAPEPPAAPDISAQWNVITPDYFGTIGIPVLRGRAFTAQDRADSVFVAIISRSFAEKMFGDEDPLGKRIRSWRDENRLREIVGIVDEVRYTGLREREVLRQVYVPHAQNSWGLMNVLVRSATERPGSLEGVLRRAVTALDPNLAISHVATLDAVARESIDGERYTTLLLSLLALTALALGAIGIYGVISHAVSTRSRELAVRAAVGASPRDLSSLVLGYSLRLTMIGLAIGVAGALAASRLLQTLLYETNVHDPAAYAVTIGTIALASAVAGLGPARRAGRIDPLATLKSE